MDLQLQGKCALATGASQGIGHAESARWRHEPLCVVT